MPKCNWEFSIYYSATVKQCGCRGDRVIINSDQDIIRLAEMTSSPLKQSPDGQSKLLSVNLAEGDPALCQVLDVLRAKYGLEPSVNRITPKELRPRAYDVMKRRAFSTREINASELLCIHHVHRRIAEFDDYGRSDDEVKRECYMAEKGYKKKKTIPMGMLVPFQAIALTGGLKAEMESANLKGLQLEPVLGAEDLWKLSSSITLPRSELRLQDEPGEFVDAESWPSQSSSKYFDDDGYHPPILRYQRSVLDPIEEFDIAVSLERVVGSYRTAMRKCIVSQKFRETMESLNVKGIEYTPVHISD